MQYRVLRGFCLGGGVDANIGDIITLPLVDAHLALLSGKVQKIETPEPAPAPANAEPAPAPQPETKKPYFGKRGKK